MPTEVESLRDELRALIADLRARRGDVEAIGARLAPLTTHADAKLRRLAAEACEFLASEHADPALATLLEDEDGYVRRMAERSHERRAVRKDARSRTDEKEQQVADLLDRIGAKSKTARKLAERAIVRERELFVRKLYHEMSTVFTSLEFAIGRIHSESAKASLDRVLLAKDAETARERLEFLGAIITSAHDVVSTVTPKYREVLARAVVDEACEQCLVKLGERASRVALTIDVDESLCFDAHEHALLQALQNLLKNAAEAYESDAPRIALYVSAHAAQRGAEIVLEVRDEGCGMTDGQKEALFIPFGSRKPGGTGVGMIMVRKMVEDVHRGALEVESTAGQGTTVRMRLPAKQR